LKTVILETEYTAISTRIRLLPRGITLFVRASDKAVVGSASPLDLDDGIDVKYEIEYVVGYEIESEDGSDCRSEFESDGSDSELSEMGHMTGLWIQNYRFQAI
jgi:hypothetical protein